MPKIRRKWSTESMKSAVEDVLNKRSGFLKAAKAYNVPKGTLIDYVKKVRAGQKLDDLLDKRLGRHKILPPEVKEQLFKHAVEMERSYYGLSVKDLQRIAYQLAIRNKLKTPFSERLKRAGRKFMKRHPQLSIRKPQLLSMARVKGFTRENVDKFYDILGEELKKINFNPERIYNVDETGITIVQHTTRKIIAVKGKKRVHKLSSGERGRLVTVVTCMSAFGHFLPPMMVFPRERLSSDIINEMPAGVIPVCHKSGWIQTHLFTRWFTEFIAKVKPTKDDPVILILDGHYSHTRNIDLIELARSNFVSIICLPPHCTDRLQPLDVIFMMPFKSYYASEIEMWLDSHPNRVLTHVQIGKLMANAFIKSSTMTIAVNGFAKTGIMPFNRNVFTDADFIAITVSDSTLQNENLANENPANENRFVDELLQEELEVEALKFTPQSASSKSTSITPEDIRPVPVITVSSTENKRAGKTCILTASLYKAALKESLEKVAAREQKKKVNQQKKSKSASTVDDPIPGTKKTSKIAANLLSTSKPKKNAEKSR